MKILLKYFSINTVLWYDGSVCEEVFLKKNLYFFVHKLYMTGLDVSQFDHFY